MKRIGVFAWADLNGGKHIEVAETDRNADAFKAGARLRAASDRAISDWQASSHDTVAEARSCIASLYGIDWFSKAKRQLEALAR